MISLFFRRALYLFGGGALLLTLWLAACDFTPIDEGTDLPLADVMADVTRANTQQESEQAVRRLLNKTGIGIRWPGVDAADLSEYALSLDEIESLAASQLRYNRGAAVEAVPIGDVFDRVATAETALRELHRAHDLFAQADLRRPLRVNLHEALGIFEASARSAGVASEVPEQALLLAIASEDGEVPTSVGEYDAEHLLSPVQRLLFSVWLHKNGAHMYPYLTHLSEVQQRHQAQRETGVTPSSHRVPLLASWRGGTPSVSPYMATATDPLGVAADFNLFVFGNVTHVGGDAEGRVAVGGSADLTSYGVGDKLSNSNGSRDDLIVGGALKASNGQVFNGNVRVAGTSSLNSFGIPNGTLIEAAPPFGFSAAEQYLKDASSYWASLGATGQTIVEYGTIKLEGNEPGLNVFHISRSDLWNANGFEIEVPPGATVLINVDGTNNRIQNFGFTKLEGATPEKTLFNLYETTQLTMQGIGVPGTVLAPYAAFNYQNGQIQGQLIAASVSATNWSGEVHHRPFDGDLPDPDDEDDGDDTLCCGETSSKFTSIVLLYLGEGPDQVEVDISNPSKRSVDGVYQGTLSYGDVFTVVGPANRGNNGFNGTLGNEIELFVAGDSPNARIHTSCSQAVLPGDVYGDFLVVAVTTKAGGSCTGNSCGQQCVNTWTACMGQADDEQEEHACNQAYVTCNNGCHDQGSVETH